MDTSSSNTIDIIENQTLKAINHMKYISKKKPCTLNIFNYLQNNYASTYYYHSVEAKLNELKSNGIIGGSYKIKPDTRSNEFCNRSYIQKILKMNLMIHIESLDPLRLIDLKLLTKL